MPEDQASAGLFLDREEIEFLAEFAVIAFGCFLELLQMRVEFFLRIPSRAVDALQHCVVLVAAPVCARHAGEFQRADFAGGMRVAAAAEVREAADRVQRDRFTLGNLLREFDLVRVAVESLDCLLARDPLARHLVIRFDDLVHASFEALEVLGRKRLLPVEIVIEPVLDGRSNGRFCIGKQVLNGIGEHVRCGMTQFRQGSAAVGRGHGPALFAHRAGRAFEPAQRLTKRRLCCKSTLFRQYAENAGFGSTLPDLCVIVKEWHEQHEAVMARPS